MSQCEKKDKKGFKVVWDDSSDDSNSKYESPHFTALAAKTDTLVKPSFPTSIDSMSYHNENSDNDDIESIQESYDLLYKECFKLKKKKIELVYQIKQKDEEITSLRDDL